MKNTLRLFTSDLKRLIRNVFALIIVIGLCAIPSLYAWFNIYSSWDPYSNTANIKVAVSTQDKGYKKDDGSTQNMGNEIIDELKANKKIGWVFTDSTDALNGVYDGRYYAAVVIGSDFTESMVNVFKEDFKEPTIVYYENEKKNAVATKITDSAVSTLKQSINEKFIEVLAESFFTETGNLSDEAQKDGGIQALENKLKRLNRNLVSYRSTINTFISGNKALKAAAQQADSRLAPARTDIAAAQQDITNARTALSEADTEQTTAEDFDKNMQANMDGIQGDISALQGDLNAILNSNDVQSAKRAALTAAKEATSLISQISSLKQSLTALENNPNMTTQEKQAISNIKDTLSGISQNTSNIQNALQQAGINTSGIASYISGNDISANEINAAIDTVSSGNASLPVPATLDGMKKALSNTSDYMANIRELYQKYLKPEAAQTEAELREVLSNASSLLDSMNSGLTDADTLLTGMQGTLDSTNASLEDMDKAITTGSERLTNLIDDMQKVSNDEKIQMLINFLHGDPEKYGKFFAQPVDVTTKSIYPIKNYGSAMAPFYTILSLWVGAMILTALIKVKAETDKIPGITQNQLFFGRYLLFFLLGQIQTAIVVFGDIFLLHCQILNRGLFWFTAAEASFIFTLLIYSLAITFGDIGKALGVVILVIQVAGSGGTYPIELLPAVYRQIYMFFPFPYAINAMRETIGGSYGNTYEINMLQLLVFAVAALIIGLIIRKPLVGLTHFMEKRMEDTKLM